MNEQAQPRKPRLLEKAGQALSTMVLIGCTLLCFVVVVQNVLNKDANLFGFRLFYVVTGSMEPTLPQNSLLVVRQQDTYEEGDIITYYAKDAAIKGQPNTHRIIAQREEDGQICYTTKGDANPVPDPLPVYQQEVIGRVCFSFGTLEVVGILLGFLTTPQGFFAIILLPLLVIALICMRDFKKTLDEELRRAAMAAMEAENACVKEEIQDGSAGSEETTA